MNTVDQLEQCHKFLSVVSNQYKYAQQFLDDCENQQQDLLHQIELENLTYQQRAKLATKLKKVRKLRRDAKNQVDQLELIDQFIMNNPYLLRSMQKLLGQVRQIKEKQDRRTYVMRTEDRCL